jgi:hypothetical protein
VTNTVVVLVSWALAVLAAYAIGRRKGRVPLGVVLGVVLGWVGVLILACLPRTHARKVELAREELQVRAEALEPPTPPDLHPR